MSIKKHLFALTFCFMALIFPVRAQTWEQTDGIPAKDSRFLKVVGNELYAGVGTHLLKLSSPEGGAWSEVNIPIDFGFTNRLEKVGETLILGKMNTGIFRSTDGGETWEESNVGLENYNINALSWQAPYLCAGTDFGIFRSLDTGKTWVKFVIPRLDPPILSIERFGNALYIGSETKTMRSADEGKTWDSLRVGASALWAQDSIIIAGGCGGTVRSTNYGKTWGRLDTFNCVRSYLYDKEGTLYAGMQYVFTLAYSKDKGATWRRFTNGLQNPIVYGLAEYGDYIYSSSDNGVGISRLKRGDSVWRSYNYGIRNSAVLNLDTCDNRLYAANGMGLYELPKGGATWKYRFGYVDYRTLFLKGDSLFAATDYGIYYLDSIKGMPTIAWNTPKDIRFVKNISGVLYAGTTIKGLWKSLDGGRVWARVDSLKNKRIFTMETVGGVMYVGTYLDGVFASSDNGEHWVPMNEGLGNPSVTFLNERKGVIFAGTKNGFYALDTAKKQWQAVNNPIFSTEVIQSASDSRHFFVATDAGVYSSPDNGATWESATTGLPLPITPTDLLIFESQVYLSTENAGVWRRRLDPVSVLEKVQSPDSLGWDGRSLRYFAKAGESVTISLCDELGREVMRLQESGETDSWRSVEIAGKCLRGVYFAVLKSSNPLRRKTTIGIYVE